ncbi:MAG: DUF1846 domain-containing protein [Spartobacteria bacterium]|nr:DUF1846 domain-containing protein [Spartobacteria bacterium]
MTKKTGFDNEKYLEEQSSAILERMKAGNGRLYLEFGGKLIYDYHAARVLPGFDPNVKIRLLHKLKDQAAILLCIYAGDIVRKKVRADFGITYDSDAMKLIDDLREWGLDVLGVVITRYEDQPAANVFRKKLENRGISVYTHRPTLGYPTDVDRIVGEEGYGANPYIPSKKPLIVVTGPGPGSGKLATCLSQLYHEHKRGKDAGYAKFETFPIWNIPLKHPVNIAYEAATADIRDFNMIDPFHFETYGEATVNYNRDVEAFPLVRCILEKITGSDKVYMSPTDMGVNRAGFGIVDDEAVQEAARQEVIRRYFRYRCEQAMGVVDPATADRVEMLLKGLNIKPEDRPVVLPARAAAEKARSNGKGHEGIFCGAAMELTDGSIIIGKNSPLMHAASSLILNAVKMLAGIPDAIHLISPNITASIAGLKKNIFNESRVSLNLEETLIALGISATTNPAAQAAVERLKDLRNCEMHMTHMPTPGDESGLRKLGVNLTTEPEFATQSLFLA